VKSVVPSDAFTADTLGTERAGSGVLIRGDGIVLTIGYLITEAETVWISLADGRTISGHALGYDQETGFGLVQALARIDLPSLSLGSSRDAEIGERAVMAAASGRHSAFATRVVAKQEFAGYWEYVLDEAIFTSPSHPNWGGAALIGIEGKLIGIGSLHVQQAVSRGREMDLNMVVPIDLLKPILNDLLSFGRPQRPARPWLGLFTTEVSSNVVVAGVAHKGPARKAGLKRGDIIVATDGTRVTSLAGFYRQVWSLGDAGVEVPLTIYREGRNLDVRLVSIDRRSVLKGPILH
jgi:S1-C subfamily serine protease